MAVSESTNLSLNGQKIIKGAMRSLGVLGKGETMSDDDQADALEALELMVKSWVADGVHLWTLSEATLFLTADTASYSLPGSRAVSSYVETATAAAASSAATSITVDSITGIADNDVLGIQVDSDTMHWTTVNGTPSGSTINFDDALTADVEDEATVYAYATTSLITRPLKIISVRRYNDGTETIVSPLSRDEYFYLSQKATASIVTQYYYDPSRATGVLYVWKPSDNVNDLLKFTWYRPIYDFDAVTNDPDFPQEWLETLKYNLALRIAPEYGVEPTKIVVGLAVSLYDKLTTWDNEDASVYFQPGR